MKPRIRQVGRLRFGPCRKINGEFVCRVEGDFVVYDEDEIISPKPKVPYSERTGRK